MIRARVRNLGMVVALAALAAAGTPSPAQAQEGIESSPKGTVGAGLIGAEVGLVVPALFGLKDAWVYLVGPLVGGGAGVAVGALLVDKSETDAAIGVSLLAVGTAALIPALVVTFAATAYDPQDELGTGGPGSQRSAVRHAQREARAAGPGLVRLSPRGAFVAAPALAVAPGQGSRSTSVEVAVLSGLF